MCCPDVVSAAFLRRFLVFNGEIWGMGCVAWLRPDGIAPVSAAKVAMTCHDLEDDLNDSKKSEKSSRRVVEVQNRGLFNAQAVEDIAASVASGLKRSKARI